MYIYIYIIYILVSPNLFVLADSTFAIRIYIYVNITRIFCRIYVYVNITRIFCKI